MIPNSKLPRGLTLVEILVVIAIIGILIAIAIPAIMNSRRTARRTECANNMRQIGIAYNDPLIGVGPTDIRNCPTYESRLAQSQAADSYFSYFENRTVDKYSVRGKTSSTMIFFEKAHQYSYQTGYSEYWFSDEAVSANRVWELLERDLAADRHSGRTANYLYADGHVQTIPVDIIKGWADEGKNFAWPGRGSYGP